METSQNFTSEEEVYHEYNNKKQSTTNSENQETNQESKKDFISLLSDVVKEYTNKININEESLEAYTRDVKNACSLLGSVFFQTSGSNILQMTAEELRKKTVNDIYNQIKIGILTNGLECKYQHSTSCQNKTILSELKNRLENEGYVCEYFIEQKCSRITVKW